MVVRTRTSSRRPNRQLPQAIAWLASLAIVVGCVSSAGTSATPTPAGAARPVAASTSAGVEIMPPDSTDIPPACRAHGGYAARRNAPPVFARGQRREPRLDSLGLGQLWVRVYATLDGKPVEPIFSLDPYPSTVRLQRVNPMWVRFDAPEGKYLLVARNFLGDDWRDTVAVRRGFVDSLTLGLGNRWICGQ